MIKSNQHCTFCQVTYIPVNDKPPPHFTACTSFGTFTNPLSDIQSHPPLQASFLFPSYNSCTVYCILYTHIRWVLLMESCITLQNLVPDVTLMYGCMILYTMTVRVIRPNTIKLFLIFTHSWYFYCTLHVKLVQPVCNITEYYRLCYIVLLMNSTKYWHIGLLNETHRIIEWVILYMCI